jgi:dihydroorotate dehydrogenase
MYSWLRKGLFSLPPETAHELAMESMKFGGRFGLPRLMAGAAVDDPLALMGIEFPNRVGLAAGLDKNGDYIDALGQLGFGHLELGTVTPKPQPGNPQPRMFRVKPAQAIINRMGFNNHGAARVAARLAALRERHPTLPGPVGVNLGCNRDSDDAVADYRVGVETFADLADYLVINVSSPNTPGLRALQAADRLRRLLGAVTEARDARSRRVPVFVKIAPDLDAADIEALVAPLLDSGVDGVLATNTTTDRPRSLKAPERVETGGLSGRPLAAIAGRVQGRLVGALGGALGSKLPVLGVGGIASGRDAYDRIAGGAAAVQLYSALVFEGPGLIRSMRGDLADLLRTNGHATVANAVGARWGVVDAA